MTEPFYLAGPTGSGKTSVALELADRVGNAAIINADAFQIYRGIEILSAAPSQSERARCPHHLFGVFELAEDCDAAKFSSMARKKIAEIAASGTLPIVVGGSGLYLKAVTHGLAPTPPGDPTLRAELDQLSLEELVSRYESKDPEGAASTNLKNRRYVTRNLEICLLTDQPASLLKRRWENDSPDIRAVFLFRNREDLYDRINRRTSQMFEAGVVAEVQGLGELSATAAKAIGLQEIRQHINGDLDEQACIDRIRQNTRRYAKRQESWFKREPSFVRIPVAPEDRVSMVVNRILERQPLPVSVS